MGDAPSANCLLLLLSEAAGLGSTPVIGVLIKKVDGVPWSFYFVEVPIFAGKNDV